MDVYWKLPAIFFAHSQEHPRHGSVQNILEKRVVHHYMKILSWQAKTICSHFRYPDIFLCDLAQIQSWNGNATKIEEALPSACWACGNLYADVWGTYAYSTNVKDIRHASSYCAACKLLLSGLSRFGEIGREEAHICLFSDLDSPDSPLKLQYGLQPRVDLEFFIEEGKLKSKIG